MTTIWSQFHAQRIKRIRKRYVLYNKRKTADFLWKSINCFVFARPMSLEIENIEKSFYCASKEGVFHICNNFFFVEDEKALKGLFPSSGKSCADTFI